MYEFKTMNRRNRFAPVFIVAGGILLLGYSYYIYTNLNNEIYEAAGKAEKCEGHGKILKQQLKVVYHHTSKLEDALRREKENHKTTKLDYTTKIKDYDLNITKSKHEALNRFSALDTSYKMLKANHDELSENHVMLQQQYVRLSDDHKRITDLAKKDFENLKSSKETESFSLQGRIQELFNSKVHYQEQAKINQEYYEQTTNQLKEATDLAHQYMARIQYFEEHTSSLQEQIKKCDIQTKNITQSASSKTDDNLVDNTKFKTKEELDKNVGKLKNELKEPLENLDGIKDALRIGLDNVTDQIEPRDKNVKELLKKTPENSSFKKSSETIEQLADHISEPNKHDIAEQDSTQENKGLDKNKEVILENNIAEVKGVSNVEIPDRFKGSLMDSSIDKQQNIDSAVYDKRDSEVEEEEPYRRALEGREIPDEETENREIPDEPIAKPTSTTALPSIDNNFPRRKLPSLKNMQDFLVSTTAQPLVKLENNNVTKKRLTLKDMLKASQSSEDKKDGTVNKELIFPKKTPVIKLLHIDGVGNPIDSTKNEGDSIVTLPPVQSTTTELDHHDVVKPRALQLMRPIKKSNIEPVVINDQNLNSLNLTEEDHIKWNPQPIDSGKQIEQTNQLQVPNEAVNQLQVPNEAANQLQVPIEAANQLQVPNEAVNQLQVPNKVVNQLQVPNEAANQPQLPNVEGNQLQVPDAVKHLETAIEEKVGRDNQLKPPGPTTKVGKVEDEDEEVDEDGKTKDEMTEEEKAEYTHDEQNLIKNNGVDEFEQGESDHDSHVVQNVGDIEEHILHQEKEKDSGNTKLIENAIRKPAAVVEDQIKRVYPIDENKQVNKIDGKYHEKLNDDKNENEKKTFKKVEEEDTAEEKGDVTLEDDENGDQNLDQNGGVAGGVNGIKKNGVVGRNNQEDLEEREENEEDNHLAGGVEETENDN